MREAETGKSLENSAQPASLVKSVNSVQVSVNSKTKVEND